MIDVYKEKAKEIKVYSVIALDFLDKKRSSQLEMY